jgi:hypothetical protein
VAERNEKNETRYREVSFGRADAIRQFDGAFLTHGNLVSGDIEKSRMSWLQNRIVWEPVDGQHIVAACHLAKEDFLQGRMSTEVYNRSYAKHKARVIMFNQPQVYIEASVRINAKEFERDFYTTLYEDMVSLRAIWVSCGKPNPEICADDARRKDAVTMAASALHMTVSFVERSFTLGSLYKRMLEYTRHAWHEDQGCHNGRFRMKMSVWTSFSSRRPRTSSGHPPASAVTRGRNSASARAGDRASARTRVDTGRGATCPRGRAAIGGGGFRVSPIKGGALPPFPPLPTKPS